MKRLLIALVTAAATAVARRLRQAAACAILGFAILSAGPARAVSILIDPGPVGTKFFANQSFAFSDLNGTIASGQTLSLDFLLPAGVDAVYRYDGIGTQELYGWTVFLTFAGGTNIAVTPLTSGVVPLDGLGAPAGPLMGTITFYNPDGSDAVYIANYNSQFFNANLLAFENVPYHGVHMNLRLFAFAESNVVVTSGKFSFTRNGTGEFTEIIAVSPVPLPAAFPLFGTGLGIMGFIGWPRKRRMG